MSTEADNVLQHCDHLLQDIISFKGTYTRGDAANVPGTDYPKAKELLKGDDIWTFYRSVLTERTSIEKAIEAGESSRIRSSNYKYLLEVWKVAKSIPHLYAIQKFFRSGPSSTQIRSNARSQRTRSVETAPAIQVEVVAGDICRTRYFLKISTMDEKRLGHDLVRAQWDVLDSSDEDEECYGKEDDGMEYISQIPIAVLARQLVSAASIAEATPILVLPYLSRDHDHGLFKYIRSIGLQFHCKSDELPIFDYAPNVPTPDSPNVPLRRIALDITTLLSVVADVCNMPPHSIKYEKDTSPQRDQAEWEARTPILPDTIYPFFETADELIAPPGVVSKMNKLLKTIGSETEKQRAAILFGTTPSSSESLVDQYNHFTIYPITSSVQLPIKTVDIPKDFVSPLSKDELEKLSTEATEIYNLAISLPEGSEVATANKQLAKMVRLYYYVERNAMGIGGRVLLHQPRSLRGFGKIASKLDMSKCDTYIE